MHMKKNVVLSNISLCLSPNQFNIQYSMIGGGLAG